MSSMDKAAAAVSLIATLKTMNEEDVNVNDLLDKHYAEQSGRAKFGKVSKLHILGSDDEPPCPVCNPNAGTFCRFYDALADSAEVMSGRYSRR